MPDWGQGEEAHSGLGYHHLDILYAFTSNTVVRTASHSL